MSLGDTTIDTNWNKYVKYKQKYLETKKVIEKLMEDNKELQNKLKRWQNEFKKNTFNKEAFIGKQTQINDKISKNISKKDTLMDKKIDNDVLAPKYSEFPTSTIYQNNHEYENFFNACNKEKDPQGFQNTDIHKCPKCYYNYTDFNEEYLVTKCGEVPKNQPDFNTCINGYNTDQETKDRLTKLKERLDNDNNIKGICQPMNPLSYLFMPRRPLTLKNIDNYSGSISINESNYVEL